MIGAMDELTPPGPVVQIPQQAKLSSELERLGVPDDAAAQVLALARRLDPTHLDIIQRWADQLHAATGSRAGMLPLADPPAVDGLDPWGHLLLFASMADRIRGYHRERAVPESISADTLTDVGLHCRVYAERYGRPGFDKAWWISLHLTGQIYQLGRLQWQRTTVTAELAAATATAGIPVAEGDSALSIHIPRFRGPMTPAAVDQSLAMAREFFAAHFDDEPVRLAFCHSWLLDPQLAQHLPPHSNIVAFQRRFRPAGTSDVDDGSPVAFTFSRPDVPLAELPRATSLERAVVDVLAAGGHWHSVLGWMVWE